eukprot:3480133-Amphidinium_carterae.3
MCISSLDASQPCWFNYPGMGKKRRRPPPDSLCPLPLDELDGSIRARAARQSYDGDTQLPSTSASSSLAPALPPCTPRCSGAHTIPGTPGRSPGTPRCHTELPMPGTPSRPDAPPPLRCDLKCIRNVVRASSDLASRYYVSVENSKLEDMSNLADDFTAPTSSLATYSRNDSALVVWGSQARSGTCRKLLCSFFTRSTTCKPKGTNLPCSVGVQTASVPVVYRMRLRCSLC